ncbi:MAG: hypothetical protein H6813_06070 [Phycisphaeraceae bacterium]|nr:hypothetical protein [Phycisphaeraceae bacterium]MCB9848036.1 hypothetical protein [Phycisphaeraceae bacterium]
MSEDSARAGESAAFDLGASSVLRALFLACSWTWCIGMFLPVLLIHDFGWPGWVAFALPNVIGAMSVGFVFRGRGSAALAADRHRLAMRWFSVVTVVFHVAFLSWLLTLAMPFLAVGIQEIEVGGVVVVPVSMGEGVAAAGIVALLVVAALLLSTVRTAEWMLAAMAVYALSMSMAAMAWMNDPGEGVRVFSLAPAAGDEPFPAILGAVPLLALGFLACPHMDLTILRTRHELAGSAGTRAFVLGFGVFFLSMIALTLLYAPGFLVGATSAYLIAHIAAQSVFTMAAHLRELRTGSIERDHGVGFSPLLALTLLLSVVALGAAWLSYTGLGQPMYELFLAPYALVFPAYAWIVMVPHRGLTRGADWAATRGARLAVFVVAVAAASPLLWMGAVGEPKRWLLAGVGAVVVVVAPVGLMIRVRGSHEHGGQ